VVYFEVWHSFCSEVCGNGIKTSSEGCDDGNAATFDGCSGSCTVECGFTCAENGNGLSECVSECGGGEWVQGEECDDGNLVDGDGCSSTCTIEDGWECPITQRIEFMCGVKTCMKVCGNGIKTPSEGCDDGNTESGDGCSAQCVVESACGYSCSGGSLTTPDTCAATACGDGKLAGDEACDDGNALNGDGCSSSCAEETGWACANVPCGQTSCSEGTGPPFFNKVGASRRALDSRHILLRVLRCCNMHECQDCMSDGHI